MTDFNSGSNSFERVLDSKNLILGNVYLIRMREPGKERIDIIGEYMNRCLLGLKFTILYQRSPRDDEKVPYNKWTERGHDRSNSECIFISFDKSEKDGVNTVYSLGKDGNKIKFNKSPDEVTKEIIEAEQKSVHHFAKKQGSKSSLPYDIRRNIQHFLGSVKGPTGGKTKRKRRSKKINKKGKTNKRKLNT